MSPIRVAINGFGRIGRQIVKAGINDPLIEFVGINDLFDLPTMVHLCKYDSVFGRTTASIEARDGALVINGKAIPVTSEKDPTKLPWKKAAAQVALECTGKFTDREGAAAHLTAGAAKVIISAPAKNADATICMGVNHQAYDPARHTILSNASCTTNCLAPVVKVVHERFRIASGFVTTIHSYTSDQRLTDSPHKDLRRARAAAVSQIPTSTGAARAVGLVLPELRGKLDGIAIRVPTPNVSCIDLVALCEEPVSAAAINAACKAAAHGALKGILAYTEEPLVSVDFMGDTHSAIVDGSLTATVPSEGARMAKIIAWYDNEAGFSQRMVDVTKYVGERL